MRQKTERTVPVDDHVLRPVDQLAERQNDRLIVLRRHDRNATELQRLQKSIRRQTTAARHQTEFRLRDQIEIIVLTQRLVFVSELDDDVASVVQMSEKRSMVFDIGVAFAFEREKNRPRATGRSTGTRIICMKKWKTDVKVRRTSEARRRDDRMCWKTKIQLAIVKRPRP